MKKGCHWFLSLYYLHDHSDTQIESTKIVPMQFMALVDKVSGGFHHPNSSWSFFSAPNYPYLWSSPESKPVRFSCDVCDIRNTWEISIDFCPCASNDRIPFAIQQKSCVSCWGRIREISKCSSIRSVLRKNNDHRHLDESKQHIDLLEFHQFNMAPSIVLSERLWSNYALKFEGQVIHCVFESDAFQSIDWFFLLASRQVPCLPFRVATAQSERQFRRAVGQFSRFCSKKRSFHKSYHQISFLTFPCILMSCCYALRCA